MPSSEMSPSEARDFLHKLITESTKVQAVVFVPSSGIKSFLSGRLYPAPDGSVVVLERKDAKSPMLGFEPARALSVWYGDERIVGEDDNAGADLFRREFLSGTRFFFKDGVTVGLFEMK